MCPLPAQGSLFPKPRTIEEGEATNSVSFFFHIYLCDHFNAYEPWFACRKCVIVIAWIGLAIFAYRVANIQPDYVSFDPFEILGIEPTASTADIRKAYRRLSLVYHPDKETGDEKKFLLITKAHAALTDESARKNWEEYGNPDGPGAMSFGIALPSWIVEKENSMFVLFIYILMLMIVLPVAVRMWWNNSSKYGGIKVLVDTTQLYYYFINKTSQMMMRKVVAVVAGSFEFDKGHNPEVMVRSSDNFEVNQLIKEVGKQLIESIKEQPLSHPYSVKARALLYAHLYRISLPVGTLEMDKNYILSKCPYLIQEFVQCGSQLTMLALARRIARCPKLETLENAMKLSALTVQGLWQGKSPLWQLPHISEEYLRHFNNRKRNIRSIQQMAVMDDKDRRQMLKGLTEEQYYDVITVLNSMPTLDIDVKSEVLDDEDNGIIATGDLVTVTVTLTRHMLSSLFGKLVEPSNKLDNKDFADSENKENEEGDGDKSATEAAKKKSDHKVWEKQKKGGKNKKGGKKKKQQQQQQSQVLRQRTAQQTGTTTSKSAKAESNDEEIESKGETELSDYSDNEAAAVAHTDDEANVGTPEAKKEGGKSHHHEDNDNDDDDDWPADQAVDTKKKEIFSTISKVSHSVHCPYFPEDKQEHWWIYISDKKSFSLKTVPYFMTNLVDNEQIELKFTAPSKPGFYQYQVNVRSDSYIDCDFFKVLKVCLGAQFCLAIVLLITTLFSSSR